MLRRSDQRGTLTALQALLFALLLTAITLIPFFSHHAGLGYVCGAVFCNGLLVFCAACFLSARTRGAARRLFIASILYLPVVLGLMVFAS